MRPAGRAETDREGVDMAKSELTPRETEALIREAEDAFPDSDFVASVDEWFSEKGFITENQEAALNKIAEGPDWDR